MTYPKINLKTISVNLDPDHYCQTSLTTSTRWTHCTRWHLKTHFNVIHVSI